MSSDDGGRGILRHVLVLVLLVAVIVVAYIIGTQDFGIETADAILTGVIVDTLLTAYLILIYMDMADFQEKQADLMDQQRELMGLQHKPRLRVRDHDIEKVVSGKVLLANVGNGVAENIFFLAEMLVSSGTGDELDYSRIEDQEYEDDSGKFIFKPNPTPLQRVKGREEGQDRHLGGALAPDEGEVWFSGLLKMGRSPVSESSIQTTTIHDVVNKLYREGIREISLSVYVLYTDIDGNIQVEHVFGRTYELESESTSLMQIYNSRLHSHSSTGEVLQRLDDLAPHYPPPD